jgi:hypothetical protein
MSQPVPAFHIGANKAGSTTLQRALFARHREVLSLGKPATDPDAGDAVASILAWCERGNSGARRPDPAALRSAWQKAVAPAAREGRCVMFSREELVRAHFYGDPDPLRLPRAIADMAGPVRVVIVARHQTKLIESLYVHKANMSRFLSPEEWFASAPERNAFGYAFHGIADAWAQVMGESNVGVFLFEELAASSATFADRLCRFLGIDPEEGARLLAGQHENVRKSERTQTYARLRSVILPNAALGRFVPGQVRRAWRDYLDGGAQSRVELPVTWRRRIEDHYRDDNRKLAARFGVPLETYGYPL